VTHQPLPHFAVDDQTWIISDTHFFHINIGSYCDRPGGWQERIIENSKLSSLAVGGDIGTLSTVTTNAC